jgi:hypothetical protein
MNSPTPAIRLANLDDDEALRRLLRETPMPGGFSVTLEREPSFFSAEIDVIRHDTAWMDGVGCASRLLKRSWWHGEEADVAYCADLRVHPGHRHRSGFLLRQVFRTCDEMQSLHPAVVTWTAVFEENHRARRVLESHRAGLPHYEDRGRLLCPALLALRGRTLPKASPEDWEEIAAFLNSRRRYRPLAPVVDAAGFHDGTRWPGLRAEDCLVKRDSGKLLGVVAVHDVRHCRQIRIQGWPRMLRAWQRPAGLLSRWTGLPRLPAVGEIMPAAYATLLTADSPDVARELLIAARAEAAQRGLGFLMAAFHEEDPLLPALRGLWRIPFSGRLYEIHRGKAAEWPAGVPLIEAVSL